MARSDGGPDAQNSPTQKTDGPRIASDRQRQHHGQGAGYREWARVVYLSIDLPCRVSTVVAGPVTCLLSHDAVVWHGFEIADSAVSQNHNQIRQHLVLKPHREQSRVQRLGDSVVSVSVTIFSSPLCVC